MSMTAPARARWANRRVSSATSRAPRNSVGTPAGNQRPINRAHHVWSQQLEQPGDVAAPRRRQETPPRSARCSVGAWGAASESTCSRPRARLASSSRPPATGPGGRQSSRTAQRTRRAGRKPPVVRVRAGPSTTSRALLTDSASRASSSAGAETVARKPVQFVGVGERLLGPPLAHAKLVERLVCGDRREPAGEVVNVVDVEIRTTGLQPRRLHRVVGVGYRTEQLISDRPQVPSIRVKAVREIYQILGCGHEVTFSARESSRR